MVEAGLEEIDRGQVEHVEPDHRLFRLVAVVMGGVARRDDKVAGPHDGLLALDLGIGALAVEDEADRRRGVAVRRRDLARHDELEPGIERLRDARLAAQRRVLQHQHPARRLLRADQRAGLVDERLHVLEMPDRRRADGLRLVRDDVLEHLPERGHVELGQPVVIGLPVGLSALGGRVRRCGRDLHGALHPCPCGLCRNLMAGAGATKRDRPGDRPFCRGIVPEIGSPRRRPRWSGR